MFMYLMTQECKHLTISWYPYSAHSQTNSPNDGPEYWQGLFKWYRNYLGQSSKGQLQELVLLGTRQMEAVGTKVHF